MKQITMCVVGNSGAGKTTCIVRYVEGYFAESLNPTVFDDYNCSVTSRGETFSVKIKDTAGQIEYKDIRILSYQEANAILLCYAINDQRSIEDIRNLWYPELQQYAAKALHVPITLAALKCDLRIEQPDNANLITAKDGRRLAKEIGAQYIECSSKDDTIGVDRAFLKVISLVETPVVEPTNQSAVGRFFSSIRNWLRKRLGR